MVAKKMSAECWRSVSECWQDVGIMLAERRGREKGGERKAMGADGEPGMLRLASLGGEGGHMLMLCDTTALPRSLPYA